MDLKYLKGIGPKRAEAFNEIGIHSIEGFLDFIPRTYLPRINISDIKKHPSENVLVYGKVIDVNYPYKRTHPITVYLNDGTGTIKIPVFGSTEFRAKQFKPTDTCIFWGKVEEGWDSTGLSITFAYRDHLKIDQKDSSDMDFLKFPFIPVYELSGVLKKTWVKPLLLSKIVFNAFHAIIKSNANAIKETIPADILNKFEHPSRKEAILRINFPREFEDIENSRRRLAFDELFYLELLMAIKKYTLKHEKKGIHFEKGEFKLNTGLVESLPFELTNAQKRVIEEIHSDMSSEYCMNRLLQGDVGSGKTVVAVAAMLLAIENGYQCAFMCPTELLAEQHYLNVSRITEPLGLKTSLLVGGQKKQQREKILFEIKSGAANIIVGTHALIQESVGFDKLGLAVIDEQHKFGVMQRAKLKEKGLNPDVLIMTATPIPRTLSMTVYGDLDVSVIDELPKGRKEIITIQKLDGERNDAFDKVKEEVAKGRQAYIVYPLIEESEKLDLRSAEKSFEYLKENVFPGLSIGMIHGRKFSIEKDEVMNRFKDGELDILVSTTVIEVGIDVPNATIMVIEDSQRFGLSQLHQLRGRVGRGAEQSYCYLVAKNLDDISKERLEIMCQTNDGFKIAEADLKLRGPGEVFGIKQSGTLNFTCTDLQKDRDLLENARNIAFEIVKKDPYLRNDDNKLIRYFFMTKYGNSIKLSGVG
ncbi:MAG TPA: ATP-dependent DNA helicase RecG [Ignavibacteria bacterium]|nr:ATP-dependent DNA helicase RecG [Ignavibacteria bacterium]